MTAQRRLLITGAGGFIGSHVAEAAIRAGWDTTLLVRYSSHGGIGNLAEIDPKLLGHARIVRGDITDARNLAGIVDGMTSVIHLAALIGIPYSYVAPESYVSVNVTGTLNVLEAARRAGVEQTVIVSTSEVYGDAETPRIDESHPLKPQSPYAATKVAAEAMARAWSCSFGQAVTVIRPFNTFGPRQSLRAVIPTIIGQAIAGDEVKLGSIWPERDFTYAGDTAEALLLAAATPELGLGPYNLGTGSSVTVGEIVQRVSGLLGRQLAIVSDEARIRPPNGEVDRLTADNGRFLAACGWRPRVTLDDGLARTIEHLRQSRTGDAAAYTV